MTEQQAQSPIDDLFRKTFETLPNTPAESGWDTPSDRVWQHVQENIPPPRTGWGIQSIFLITLIAVTLGSGLYWMFSGPSKKPVAPPSVTPVEQPVAIPSASGAPVENQTVAVPKPSTSNGTAKDTQSKPVLRNNSEQPSGKPASNTAQPLPGSKQTLPPNTTEAQKKNASGN